MGRKLTEEKQEEILETGIAAFAESGLHGAGMADIARRAGISVGVLYKYYENKEAFFQACLRHSLTALEQVLEEVTAREEKLLRCAEAIIRALQAFGRTHPNHIRMYHQITVASGDLARQLAEAIEGVTARLYTAFITSAQAQGDLRGDIDPRLFAFFFDNLLMMLQFSYCCDYYRARFALYGGGSLPEEGLVERELLKFLESAFTTEQSQIPHRDHSACPGSPRRL